MPQYHLTVSKIRIHAFMCMVALIFPTLLQQRAKQADLFYSLLRIVNETPSLRSATLWMPDERKGRCILETPTHSQIHLLHAIGFDIKDN